MDSRHEFFYHKRGMIDSMYQRPKLPDSPNNDLREDLESIILYCNNFCPPPIFLTHPFLISVLIEVEIFAEEQDILNQSR